MKKKTYTSSATAVCANCNGEGSIEIPGEHLGHGRFGEPQAETCEVCEGSGLVTVDKTTVVSISPKNPRQ